MSVRYVHGDITADDADILVNTVNYYGVCGKGVALAFKTRWPSIMFDYQAACSLGFMKPGGCLLFFHPDQPWSRYWAALATKDQWQRPSRYDWIESGLVELSRLARSVNVHSIAIPPPGCGNGGLEWRLVHPMVLVALSGFDLRIYGSPP
jgi:O-acetyl-ADP-ribose deacetylase (regulator of RNase III)